MSNRRAAPSKARSKARMDPEVDLPPPLLSNVVGTWAYDMMSRRINEEILQNMVVKDNESNLSKESVVRLKEFVEELEKADKHRLRPINDKGFDSTRWNEDIVSNYSEKTWLDAPWLVTEYVSAQQVLLLLILPNPLTFVRLLFQYFYRRILEAVGYFSGELGDPFEAQKQKGLQSCFPALKSLSKLVLQAITALEDPSMESKEYYFKAILLTSLWGNRMDLSIWPAEATSDPDSTERAKDAIGQVLKSSSKMLLADDSEVVWEAVKASSPADQMDIIADNAGFELITDLCLADFLVSSGLSHKVVIHLKPYPVFVSDAMEKDVLSHIEALTVSMFVALFSPFLFVAF